MGPELTGCRICLLALPQASGEAGTVLIEESDEFGVLDLGRLTGVRSIGSAESGPHFSFAERADDVFGHANAQRISPATPDHSGNLRQFRHASIVAVR